jgi:hypothetical protein
MNVKSIIALKIVIPNIIGIACMIAVFIYGWNHPDRAYYMIVCFVLALFTTIAYLGCAIWVSLKYRAFKKEHKAIKELNEVRKRWGFKPMSYK